MPRVAFKRIRLAYIVAAYLTFALVIFRGFLVHQEALADFLFAISLAVFVTMACVADAAVLGRPIAFEVRFPFAVTWPIALPIYLLRSRGWLGLAVLVAILGAVIGTAISCAVVGVVAELLLK
jgi:hypothetical protein